MYRLRDIEEWLLSEGIEAKIGRARTPLTPLRHITLTPGSGAPLQVEDSISRPALQVVCRDGGYDQAEELAYQVDMIFIPPADSPFFGSEQYPKEIERHDKPGKTTRILACARTGGEPALLEVTNQYVSVSCNYLFTAER